MSKALSYQLAEICKEHPDILQEVCDLLWDVACGDADKDEIMEFFKDHFDEREDDDDNTPEEE